MPAIAKTPPGPLHDIFLEEGIFHGTTAKDLVGGVRLFRVRWQLMRNQTGFLNVFLLLSITPALAGNSNLTLDAYIAPYVAADDFSGIVLVARGDNVLYQTTVGFANIDIHSPVEKQTRFLVGSVAKTFTAAGIELLEKHGKLAYDDPLSRFVPEYRYSTQITLRQLLAHEAGVPDFYAVTRFAQDRESHLSLPAIAHWLSDFPLDFKPGSRSNYSNSGYSLLALAIERASGQSYAEFLQARIFKPLGMMDSGAFLSVSTTNLATGYDAAPGPQFLQKSHGIDTGWLVGNGYVYSTAADLSRWLDVANAQTVINFKTLPYPYGWGMHKEGGYTLLEQDGRIPGYTSSISIDPTNSMKVVVLSNVQDNAASRISNDVRSLVLGTSISPPAERPTAVLAPDKGGDYAGVYALGESLRLRITAENGNVFLQNETDRIPIVLDPTGPDHFFFRTLYVPLIFLRAADGRVNAMRWNDQFTLAKTELSRK